MITGRQPVQPVGPRAVTALDNPYGRDIDPDAEDQYWREAYPDAPYFDPSRSNSDYAQAFRLGYEGRQRYRGSFETAEPWLRREWDSLEVASSLDWQRARPAVCDAWQRIERLSQISPRRDGF